MVPVHNGMPKINGWDAAGGWLERGLVNRSPFRLAGPEIPILSPPLLVRNKCGTLERQPEIPQHVDAFRSLSGPFIWFALRCLDRELGVTAMVVALISNFSLLVIRLVLHSQMLGTKYSCGSRGIHWICKSRAVQKTDINFIFNGGEYRCKLRFLTIS